MKAIEFGEERLTDIEGIARAGRMSGIPVAVPMSAS